MKTFAVLSFLAALASFASAEARADYYRCAQARQQLAAAESGLAQARSMAANSVAICGQSASCYSDIAAAVNIAQQAVYDARREVAYSCRGGR